MPYLTYLRQKLKYNSPLRLVHDGLERIGIGIDPYYLELQEGLPAQVDVNWERGFEAYEAVVLGPQDMQAIAGTDGHNKSEKTLLQWLDEGRLCLGIKCNGELAAFTWANLRECDFIGHRFPLMPNEAYLFNTFTLPAFRGRRIAPYARYCMYKELVKLHRTRAYSVSHYLNAQARNFKRKLNVRPVEFRLHISLFGVVSYSWLIKRMVQVPAAMPDSPA